MKLVAIILFLNYVAVQQVEALSINTKANKTKGKWCVLGMCISSEESNTGAAPAVPEFEGVITEEEKKKNLAKHCLCGYACGPDDGTPCYKTCCPGGNQFAILANPLLNGGNQCKCDFPCWIQNDGSACFTNCCGSDEEKKMMEAKADRIKQALEMQRQEAERRKQEIYQQAQIRAQQDAEQHNQKVGDLSCGCNFVCGADDGSLCYGQCCASGIFNAANKKAGATATVPVPDMAAAVAGLVPGAPRPKAPEAKDPTWCKCDFPCWLNPDGSTCFTHCCGTAEA